ncbi:MAG: hypothetical protein AB8G86_26580 [Saprospiraceae bacterium]
MRKWIFFIGLIFGLVAFQSCKTTQPAVYPEPIIGAADFDYWIHTPLHPDNNQAVTFKTKVADAEGITKVELMVYEYELYENSDGLPSKRRRIDSQWGLVYDWEFSGQEKSADVAFNFPRGFSAFSNVEYIFRVHNTKGEVSERLAIFDAGDSRWPLDKITLYATSRNPLTNSINLCLFPDMDYQQDWRGFLTDMEKLVFDGFHQNNKIKDHKKNWQFYYTQREADGLAISKNFYEEDVFPSFVKNSEIQGMDAYGLMHKEPYSDGAYLKNNIHFLAYNLFTAESYNFGTAIHESAHAIFNLSDEYDLCACFEHPDGANMFASLKGCQDFNRKNGFSIDDCTPLEHLNGQSWFMSEPSAVFETKELCEAFNAENDYENGICERFKDYDGQIYYRALDGLCIMQDDGDHIVRDFKRTCGRIIDNFYDKLNRQSTIAFNGNMENIENIFGYEPVIVMEMVNEEAQLAFKFKGIQNGIPKKNLAQRDAIQLDFIQASGDKYSLSLSDPEHMHIHKDVEEDEVVDIPSVNYTFSVPYCADFQTMICAKHPAKNDQLVAKSVDLKPAVEISRLDLEAPLKEAQEMMTRKE